MIPAPLTTLIQHTYPVTVYYSDTDCYGVVWHGSYIRWLEMGRTEYLTELGYDLLKLDGENIIFPVIEQTCKYKASARLGDTVNIVTQPILTESRISIGFKQDIYNKKTGKLLVESTVILVPITKDGTLYRKPPHLISELKRLATISP